MATKKGLCPYCSSKRMERRIFPVSPEASTCFCPLCMKEMEPQEAINGYHELLDKMLLKADNTLFVTCDPVLAYSEYAEVIELEPKETHALLGRILCLIYMGKVRKSFLSEALTMLENLDYQGCDIDKFAFFLKKINFALDEYQSVIAKRLTFRTYFYDVECLKLYWVHLTEIVRIKELIISISKAIKKEHVSTQIEVIINMIDHNVDELRASLHKEEFTADGKCYSLSKVVYGIAVISTVDKKSDTKLLRYRLSTLDENEKHKKYIKDEVFKDYTHIVNMEKAFFSISIIFYLIMSGFIAATILLKDNPIYLYSFAASAIASFVIATVLFVLHISWKLMLKKRKLRID